MKKKTIPNTYRQGDVLIIATRKIPNGLTPVKRDKGRVVLAYGEITGHAHAIASRDARLLEGEDLNVRFLEVLADGGVALRHEEHATITIPRGTYRVVRQREYAPDAIRNVAD
jgi:hypothetical protein